MLPAAVYFLACLCAIASLIASYQNPIDFSYSAVITKKLLGNGVSMFSSRLSQLLSAPEHAVVAADLLEVEFGWFDVGGRVVAVQWPSGAFHGSFGITANLRGNASLALQQAVELQRASLGAEIIFGDIDVMAVSMHPIAELAPVFPDRPCVTHRETSEYVPFILGRLFEYAARAELARGNDSVMPTPDLVFTLLNIAGPMDTLAFLTAAYAIMVKLRVDGTKLVMFNAALSAETRDQPAVDVIAVLKDDEVANGFFLSHQASVPARLFLGSREYELAQMGSFHLNNAPACKSQPWKAPGPPLADRPILLGMVVRSDAEAREFEPVRQCLSAEKFWDGTFMIFEHYQRYTRQEQSLLISALYSGAIFCLMPSSAHTETGRALADAVLMGCVPVIIEDWEADSDRDATSSQPPYEG